MPSDICCVCMEKCSQQVCFTCTCKAHPRCWGEFQKHSQICPTCRGENILRRPQTRSQSKSTEIIVGVEEIQSRTDLIERLRTAIELNSDLVSYEERIQNVSVVFSLLLAGRAIGIDLLENQLFRSVVINKLREFYNMGWQLAADWHQLFFNVPYPTPPVSR